jgi:hypothetical protein
MALETRCVGDEAAVQDSITIIVTALVLCAPFVLWAALFLSFLLLVMVVLSATLLSDRVFRVAGRRPPHQ